MDTLSTLPDQLVAGLMALAILQAFCLAGIYCFRHFGNRKANLCFGILQLVFGLAITNNLLARSGLMLEYRQLYFLPIWYTLSFGPLLFYYIKFTLYPSYQIRSSDGKHFILPIVQTVFYLSIGFRSVAFKSYIWEAFIAPFYKTAEGVAFVASFFSYLAISYRYIKYRQATLRRKGSNWERRKVKRFQNMMKLLFALTCLNTFYIITDFVTYNYFNLTLYKTAWFSILGDISFVAMLLTLSIHGWRVLYGRLHEKGEKGDLNMEQVKGYLLEDNRFTDPEFKFADLSYGLQVDQPALHQFLQQQGYANIKSLLLSLRSEAAKSRIRSKRHRDLIAFELGFHSIREFERNVDL